MTMLPTSWEELDTYLSQLVDDDNRFELGYRYFTYLMNKLRPFSEPFLEANHPLTLQLMGASRRLNGVVARIECAQGDPHLGKILTRLAKASDFTSALQELDAFRRLSIAGLAPSFVPERKGVTTPDILVNVGGRKTWVEVTSINNEIEISPAEELLTHQGWFNLMSSILVGGIVKGPVSKEDLVFLESDVHELAMLARTTKELHFMEGNKRTIFAIPKEMAEEVVPERFRNGFLHFYDRKSSHVEHIILRVEEKVKKKYSEADEGFIVIYDYFMDDEELLRILKDDNDPITQYLEAHPEIIGIAVILPPGHTADFVMTGNSTTGNKVFKVYLVQPDSAKEMLLLWRNPATATDNRIVEAFTSFDRNQPAPQFFL